METIELLKKIRKIEIKTRQLSNQIFAGEFHSAFKGRGMTFSEVRDYQPGDDIRTIDWNVTARFSEPYVKVFEEERELTVMLLVDISESENFGTSKQYKKDLLTEMCAVLAFAAMQNNDKIGVLFFSDKIEKYIPPKKGKSHILQIIRELIELKPTGKGTDINLCLQYFNNMVKKKCIAFLISDFIAEGYEEAIKIANRKHDLVALQVYDQRESSLPDVGLVQFYDKETGKQCWIDTSDKKTRDDFEEYWKNIRKKQQLLFAQNKIDAIDIQTDESYIRPLTALFKRRAK